MSFAINAKPHPKGRPRFFSRGKFVQVYTDAKTKAYELMVGALAKEAMGAHGPYSGPLRVVLDFHMLRPKSLKGLHPHIKKPDVDNLAKSVLDGMNKIVYDDDSQIIVLLTSKEYAMEDEKPRTVVSITRAF